MNNKTPNNNKVSCKKNIRFERDLIEAIEKAKDPSTSFSAWVKQACHEKINGKETRKKPTVRTHQNKAIKSGDTVRTLDTPIMRNGKGSYIYHTPKGTFTGRNPASEANGLTPHTLAKRCKEGYEGYSLEAV